MRGEIKRNLDCKEQQQPWKLCFLPSKEKGEKTKQTDSGLFDGRATELRCLKAQPATEQYRLTASCMKHLCEKLTVLIDGFKNIFWKEK